MKKAIFIIGMHRSGTSCLAKCLAANGLSFTLDQLKSTIHPGHLEYGEVNRLNNRILGGWKRPNLHHGVFKRYYFRRSVEKFVRRCHRGSHPVGIKDPRLALTFEYWAHAVDSCKIVAVYRRPLEVVQSFEKREPGYKRVGSGDALELWKSTNERVVQLHNDYGFPIANFNLPRESFQKNVEAICRYLDLNFSTDSFNNAFRESERHHENPEIPASLKPIYEELERRAIGQFGIGKR
jgi:hypothetical protein